MANGVREVRTVRGTDLHIDTAHQGQFDIARAMALVPGVLDDPLFVARATKPGSLLFVGEYDERYYLIIPVKLLPGETWLESMFIDSKMRFIGRRRIREGLLYVKAT